VNIEEAVRSILADDDSIKALVSTRVMCGWLPQGVIYPCVTIYPVSEDENEAVNDTRRKRYARLQIDVWAETYAGAKALADLVVDALHTETFSLTGIEIGASSALTGGQYMYADAVKMHRRSRDFGFWFVETA
jgi:hypothetical protein